MTTGHWDSRVGRCPGHRPDDPGTANITVFPRERLSFRLGTLYSDAMNNSPDNGNNIYGIYSLAMFGKPEYAYCDDMDGDGNMDVLPEPSVRPRRFARLRETRLVMPLS